MRSEALASRRILGGQVRGTGKGIHQQGCVWIRTSPWKKECLRCASLSLCCQGWCPCTNHTWSLHHMHHSLRHERCQTLTQQSKYTQHAIRKSRWNAVQASVLVRVVLHRCRSLQNKRCLNTLQQATSHKSIPKNETPTE